MNSMLKSIFSKEYAIQNNVCAIELNDEKIVIATNKFDIHVINYLKHTFGREVEIVYKSIEDVEDLIRETYDFDGEIDDSDEVVYKIIENAVDKKASDIHFEPQKSEVRIRFRIKGDLIVESIISDSKYQEIISILKIYSGCDITERKKPQDGSFSYENSGYDVDLRFSVIPTVFGEKIVLRILNRKDFIKTKSELGFSVNAISIIDDILSVKSGLFIVSGSTGSGKSTTIYSLMNELNKNDVNITTIEDPVEFKMEGINQIQVNEKQGMLFINALKSILRQDPDYIVLGEIRDIESAEVALRAALTGHLVIATLHTRDAISTIIRLVDMGIEPYLVSSTLIGVISQKLIKKDSDRRLIYEILKVTEGLRECIKTDLNVDKMKKIAIEGGMITYEDSMGEIL